MGKTGLATGRALAGLPAAQRVLIEAAFFEGYNPPGTGGARGCAAGNGQDTHPHRTVQPAGTIGARRITPADIEALALADAVGALDPDERRQLFDRLATLAPDVQQQVARLYDHALEIASEAGDATPEPALRARVGWRRC